MRRQTERLRGYRPAFTRWGVPAGARTSVDEWRAFGHPRYRTYLRISATAATVFALAGDGLTIPLLLALGAPAAVVQVIGVLPLTFSVAQLLVPTLLRRTDGNLRGVTLVILFVGEMRGFILAAVVVLHELRVVSSLPAILLIAAVMSLAGAASGIGGANLQAWYGAILPERERRFVAPRVQGIVQGLGAILLLPAALGVQAGLATIGLSVYAVVFAVAGLFGLLEILAVRRLQRPGRVRVARRGAAPPLSGETRVFIRDVAISAFGAGLTPYISIYAITVLGTPPGFAIVLSALGAGASLVAATVVGGWLHRGSSSRVLRLSFVLRGGGVLLGLLAFPSNPAAPLILCAVAVVTAVGWAAGTLAANERLLRLTGGSNLIDAQAGYVAWTSIGATGGQVTSGVVMAALPVAFPAFALLFLVSGMTRVVLAATVHVGPSWTSATTVFDIDELRKG